MPGLQILIMKISPFRPPAETPCGTGCNGTLQMKKIPLMDTQFFSLKTNLFQNLPAIGDKNGCKIKMPLVKTPGAGFSLIVCRPQAAA